MKKHLFILFIFCSGLIINSCNQNTTQLGSCEFKIIYSYSSNNSYPSTYLSVFTETFSDPRLISSMEIENPETTYKWTIDKIEKIQKESRTFVGYSHLMVPDGKAFPVGNYKIKFTTYDGSSSEVSYNFGYDKSFLEKKIKDLGNPSPEEVEKKIAAYNENNMLIYYGFKNDEFNDKKNIKNIISDAVNYNEVWIYSDGSEIIIFPDEELNSES